MQHDYRRCKQIAGFRVIEQGGRLGVAVCTDCLTHLEQRWKAESGWLGYVPQFQLLLEEDNEPCQCGSLCNEARRA